MHDEGGVRVIVLQEGVSEVEGPALGGVKGLVRFFEFDGREVGPEEVEVHVHGVGGLGPDEHVDRLEEQGFSHLECVGESVAVHDTRGGAHINGIPHLARGRIKTLKHELQRKDGTVLFVEDAEEVEGLHRVREIFLEIVPEVEAEVQDDGKGVQGVECDRVQGQGEQLLPEVLHGPEGQAQVGVKLRVQFPADPVQLPVDGVRVVEPRPVAEDRRVGGFHVEVEGLSEESQTPVPLVEL